MSLSLGDLVIVIIPIIPIAFILFSLVSGVVLYPPTLRVQVRRSVNPGKYWALFLGYSLLQLALATILISVIIMKTKT